LQCIKAFNPPKIYIKKNNPFPCAYGARKIGPQINLETKAQSKQSQSQLHLKVELKAAPMVEVPTLALPGRKV